MKKLSEIKYRSQKGLVRGIFGFFSLSAMLFIFQACYGIPQDFGLDVLIEGTVTSKTDGKEIPNIRVSLGDQQYTITNDQGQFYMYCPRQDLYGLQFTDTDGELNKLYAPLDTTLSLKDEAEEIRLNIQLEEQ